MALYALFSILFQCSLCFFAFNSKDKHYQSLPFLSCFQDSPPSHIASALKSLPSTYRTDSTLLDAQAVTHPRKAMLQVLPPNGQSPEQDSCILLLTWPVARWMHLDTQKMQYGGTEWSWAPLYVAKTNKWKSVKYCSVGFNVLTLVWILMSPWAKGYFRSVAMRPASLFPIHDFLPMQAQK